MNKEQFKVRRTIVQEIDRTMVANTTLYKQLNMTKVTKRKRNIREKEMKMAVIKQRDVQEVYRETYSTMIANRQRMCNYYNNSDSYQEGEFWRILLPGIYTMEVFAEGFAPKEIDFAIVEKNPTVLNITLRRVRIHVYSIYLFTSTSIFYFNL